MRSLSQIIEAAKSTNPATEEELRYALCALDSLATFDKLDLMKMGLCEQEGSKPFHAWMRYEESFKRWKLALAVDPKSWLGLDNDPVSPDYQKRRTLANRILDAAIEGKLPNQRATDGPPPSAGALAPDWSKTKDQEK